MDLRALIDGSPVGTPDAVGRVSGITREGPRYAVEEMTERRLVVLAP